MQHFNEDTRVKLPATAHFLRLGYKYQSLKDAQIIVETLPAVTHCEDCLKDYPTVKYGKICPHCGSEHTYLLRGNELTIKQIEAVDTEE